MYLINYPILPLSHKTNHLHPIRWSDESDVTFDVTLGNDSGATGGPGSWMIHISFSSVAVSTIFYYILLYFQGFIVIYSFLFVFVSVIAAAAHLLEYVF